MRSGGVAARWCRSGRTTAHVLCRADRSHLGLRAGQIEHRPDWAWGELRCCGAPRLEQREWPPCQHRPTRRGAGCPVGPTAVPAPADQPPRAPRRLWTVPLPTEGSAPARRPRRRPPPQPAQRPARACVIGPGRPDRPAVARASGAYRNAGAAAGAGPNRRPGPGRGGDAGVMVRRACVRARRSTPGCSCRTLCGLAIVLARAGPSRDCARPAFPSQSCVAVCRSAGLGWPSTSPTAAGAEPGGETWLAAPCRRPLLQPPLAAPGLWPGYIAHAHAWTCMLMVYTTAAGDMLRVRCHWRCSSTWKPPGPVSMLTYVGSPGHRDAAPAPPLWRPRCRQEKHASNRPR